MASFRYSVILLLATALYANDPDGTTPLHYAVRSQNAAQVRTLLAKNMPADAQNRYGVIRTVGN